MLDARRALAIPEADTPKLEVETEAHTMYLVTEIWDENFSRDFLGKPGLKKLNRVDFSQELRSRALVISKYFLAVGLVGHFDGRGINSGFSTIKYSGNSFTW